MVERTRRTTGRWSLLGTAGSLVGRAVAELAELTWALSALTLAAAWVGLPLFTTEVRRIRRMADRRRRWVGEAMGATVESRYRALPERGWLPRFSAAVRDPATWRDLWWLTVDCTLGLAITLLPVALFAAGVLGLLLPVIWLGLPSRAALDFPFGLRVTDVASAGSIGVPNGIIYLALWWALTPWIMRRYTQLSARLLRPGERARLSERVEELSTSRAQTVDQQASELRRIERDLHDGAQAHLVALGMSLGLAENLLAGNPHAKELLAEARAHNTQAIAELRALIRGIRPTVLSDRGLAGAVEALAMRIPLTVEVDIAVPDRLPEPVESAAYFSVSELLANIVKHAAAAHASVRGRQVGDRLQLTVTDDGRGGATIAAGGGLDGIRQRLGAFDGTLTVRSAPGAGTTATIDLPVRLAADAPGRPDDSTVVEHREAGHAAAQRDDATP